MCIYVCLSHFKLITYYIIIVFFFFTVVRETIQYIYLYVYLYVFYFFCNVYLLYLCLHAWMLYKTHFSWKQFSFKAKYWIQKLLHAPTYKYDVGIEFPVLNYLQVYWQTNRNKITLIFEYLPLPIFKYTYALYVF